MQNRQFAPSSSILAQNYARPVCKNLELALASANSSFAKNLCTSWAVTGWVGEIVTMGSWRTGHLKNIKRYEN